MDQVLIRIGLSLHRRETLGEETVSASEPDNHQIDQARNLALGKRQVIKMLGV